jgi:predicted nucleic acid-binding protein
LVIVIDASLAVKWYIREKFSLEAMALFEEYGGAIIVPEIFVIEVIGVLVRRANIDKSLRIESEESLRRFRTAFDEQEITAQRSESVTMAQATALALDLGHPLKDCLYLALAMELDCDLVTCDARFAEKAKGVWDRVRVLGV